VLPRPRQLADGQAVAVGRGQRELLAGGLEQHGGEDRTRLVVSGGPGHLARGDRDHLAGHGADPVQRGLHQRREVVGVQQPQLVGDAPAADAEPAVGGLDLDNAGRQVADDVAEHPAWHHDPAVVLAGHLHDGLAGVLQVGRSQPEPVVAELHQGAAEHRQCRPRRDRPTDPRDGIRERVSLCPKAHLILQRGLQGTGAYPQRIGLKFLVK
jgi:hypothetical protein